MKKFILKLSLFSAICLGIVTFVLMNYGGNIDYFYEKFTIPKTKSMIVGDSRSFQGIQPAVINEYFKDTEYNAPMLNYSFTIAQAIIGPLYNESIYKKLDESADNGIFIISVTPEMLTVHEGYDNAAGEFREEGQPPHNMNFVNTNPNYEYLIKNLSFFHFRAMFRQKSKVHKDGWLEETNLPTDEKVFEDWKENQISMFLKDAKKSKLSEVRIQSLSDLINKLKQHGHVFLVRMPISKEFLSYEEQYFPTFGNVIENVAKSNEISYFDFNVGEMKYKTYDGHHIDKFSGKEFTKVLSDSILNSIKKRKRVAEHSVN